MGFLQADKKYVANNVTVNEFLLTKHNPNGIAMPSAQLSEVIGVTIHNTDWITTASGTHPSEQYTRATYNGNMNDVRVHFYVDNIDAWQTLPLTLTGWHAADGNGPGNMKTIAVECIMSSNYNSTDQKSEDNAARLCAYLLDKYKFGIDHLYTHQHWYPAKYCPAYILPHYSKFVDKVKSYLKGTAPAQTPTTDNSEMYRVRKSWGDAKSQVGAYRNLESAKDLCNKYPGYSVYNKDGKAVYTNEIVITHFGVELRTLRKGMKGNDVKSLQQLLFAKGYSVGATGDDGDFGSATEKAVLNFQADNDIDKDGIVGIDTFKKIWGI
jgi:N-acetylmuramoyl-L-alanine amidase